MTVSWKRNKNFNSVPPALLVSLKDPWTGKQLDIPTFYAFASWLDKCPNTWNSFLYVEGEVKAVMWGEFSPIFKELYVRFLSSTPDVQSYRGDVLKVVYKELKSLAKALGLERIYFFTSNPKAYSRKIKPVLKIYTTYLVEVI